MIIGAGVVGMAICQQLATSIQGSTFLVERHPLPGQETSSRNSEVIHAGIYYPPQSLKTRLCVQGRQLLYSYCEKNNVPHRKTQKLIVATSESQKTHLKQLYEHASNLPKPPGAVPLRLISGKEARALEPDLSEDVSAALLSPETGIVDAHSLIERLEAEVEDQDEAAVVYGTRVVRIDRSEDTGRGAKGKRGDGGMDGWVVQTENESGEKSAILAKCVVNSAGLSAHHIVNHILPESKRLPLFFCKGSYFAYRGPGVSNVKHLIYPCPEPGLAGLGTHLTMNLANEIRFGPDVEWLKAPDELDENNPGFWTKMLEPNEERHDQVFEAVRGYLPGVERNGFRPDYSGIRPKLKPDTKTPEDFSITHIAPGFINLMGIESPGLTSSLAIAAYVEQMVRKEVFGLGIGRGKTISGVGRIEEDWA